MKLPTQIVTRNKVRDFEICRLYAEESQSQNEIGKVFDLTEARIGQILRKNKVLLSPDREWEKYKRINWIKRQIKKRGDSHKDSLEMIDRLKIEIDGDKPLIDQSVHTHFQFEYGVVNEDKVRASQSSDAGVGIPSEVEGFGGRPEVRENLTGSSYLDKKGIEPAEG